MFGSAYMGRELDLFQCLHYMRKRLLPSSATVAFGPHSKSVARDCRPVVFRPMTLVRTCGYPHRLSGHTLLLGLRTGEFSPDSLALGPLTLGDAGCDHVQGAVSGKCRTFLPTDDMAGVVAGKVDATLGLDPNLVAWRGTHVGITDPGPKVVGDVSPADVNGVLQFVERPGCSSSIDWREAASLASGLGKLPNSEPFSIP